MTTQEYYALPTDENGWRTLPNGNRFKIGAYAEIGQGAEIGPHAKIGPYAEIGARVKIERTPVQVYCHPYLVYPHSPTQIGVGCVIHDVEYWMRPEDPAELPEHPECNPWSRYREAIALVALHIDDLTI